MWCHGHHHCHPHGYHNCHRNRCRSFPCAATPYATPGCGGYGCGGYDGFYLPIDLPGIDHEDLNVQLNGNTLTVSALCHHCHCDEPSKYVRHFDIDSNIVDVSNLKADLTNSGVLVVQAPKKAKEGGACSIPVTKKDDSAQEEK